MLDPPLDMCPFVLVPVWASPSEKEKTEMKLSSHKLEMMSYELCDVTYVLRGVAERQA